MDNLDTIADRIRANFTAKNAARDGALERSRTLIRHCANAIRAVHRDESPLPAEHCAAARTWSAASASAPAVISPAACASTNCKRRCGATATPANPDRLLDARDPGL